MWKIWWAQKRKISIRYGKNTIMLINESKFLTNYLLCCDNDASNLSGTTFNGGGMAMSIHCSHWIYSIVITLGGVMSMTVFWSVKWECKIEAIKSEYGGKKWFWLGSTEFAFSCRHKNPRIFMEVLCTVEMDTLFSYFGQKTCQFSNFIAKSSRFRSM